MKIHLYDSDERQFTDKENYEYNHGPFSTICIQLNKELKKLNYYSEPDDADWVGTSDGLNISFKYKNKQSFVISVWEYANTLPYYLINNARQSKQKIFGLTNQITDLWKNYGFEAKTLYFGCDTEFWKPICPKNKEFTFLFLNSSNVRSGLDLAIQSFCLAFTKNKDVKFLIKDTNNSKKLQSIINYYKNTFECNIEYISKRMSDFEIRELYSKSHVCLNVMRCTSGGFPLLESSACNCLSITGDIPSTNELIKKEYGILLSPNGLINISSKLSELTEKWGLLNCYPQSFDCPEIPKFWDFSIFEYSNTLRDIYNNLEKYSKIDTRTPIINEWGWDKSVNKLIKYLSN